MELYPPRRLAADPGIAFLRFPVISPPGLTWGASRSDARPRSIYQCHNNQHGAFSTPDSSMQVALRGVSYVKPMHESVSHGTCV